MPPAASDHTRAGTGPTGAATVDGRSARSARSRRLVVDAFLDLVGEGEPQPTAQQASERSGVSMRTIFRLFEDVDALHSTAIAAQFERIGHLFAAPPADGSLDRRIRSIVEKRSALFDAIAPVRRLGLRLVPTSAPIRNELARADRVLRSQVAAQFAPELTRFDSDSADDALEALDAALSWSLWDRLRTEQGLSETTSRDVVVTLVRSVLDP